MIEVKGSDVRAGDLVVPGWYIVEVKNMTVKAAKTDGSNNFNYSLKVISDLKGDTRFEDARVKDFLINEKGVFGSGLTFLSACDPAVRTAFEALKKDKNAPTIPIDENAPVGKQMKAMIKTSEWEGRKSNEAVDFLPL